MQISVMMQTESAVKPRVTAQTARRRRKIAAVPDTRICVLKFLNIRKPFQEKKMEMENDAGKSFLQVLITPLIAIAPDSRQVFRLGRVGFNFDAEPADIDINGFQLA